MADLAATGRRTTPARRVAGRVALAAAVAVAAALAGPAAAHAAPAPGRAVVVRLEPGRDPDAGAREAAARGARVTHVYRDVFPGYAAVLPPGGLRGAEGGPGVVGVDPDTPVRRAVAPAPEPAIPADPTGPVGGPDDGQDDGAVRGAAASWGLDRVDQRALPLSGTYTPDPAPGRGVTAYVVDGGVDAEHRDLGGRVRAGFTAIDDGRGTGDCEGHGTHVAGTIGGAAYGVAPAVTLVAVRTLDCSGSGETSGIVAGLDWVARDHRRGTPAVANLSLAGDPSDAVDAAVRGLVADGVTVTVAAGNEDADACGSSPSREPAALTVAATARDDSRAPFSNRGSCVDLFAPGVDVVSDGGTGPTATRTLSGTSMASPHVAGAAALLLGAEPTLTPAQVAARLLAAATPGAVRGERRGDPDRLLYVGPAAPAASSPRPAPGTPPAGTPALRRPGTPGPEPEARSSPAAARGDDGGAAIAPRP